MPLTDIAVRKAKAGPKPYKLTDSAGLYLLVTTTGSRLWRYDYRHADKRQTAAIGAYPETGLAQAREERDRLRKLLRDGTSPSIDRQRRRLEQQTASVTTFEAVAEEWLQKWIITQGAATTTVDKHRWTLAAMYPEIGRMPISQLKASDLLVVLRAVEKRGTLEKARRMRSVMQRVFTYAVSGDYCSSNPAIGLNQALTPPKVKHHAAIFDHAEIGALLRAIRGYEGRGSGSAAAALRLLPYVFVRPGELRAMEWCEVNFDQALWTIPAARAKGMLQHRVIHLVPLSRQAIVILQSRQPFTGSGKYVFPSITTDDRPMSENTLNAVLRKLGYGTDEMRAHGFRRIASTIMNEHKSKWGLDRDWIEAQLAHREPNQVRAAYNAAQYIEHRAAMMQMWADWLDQVADQV
jgi:integrase